MKKYTCIIVDDVEIDRLMIQLYLNRFSNFELIGAFSTAQQAIEVLEKTNVDILFLDIDLPNSSGIEIRKKALEVPVCIFITSHPDYALESFELETLDYIIKPLNFDRFSKTIKRIDEYLELKNKASLFEATIGGGSIYIKESNAETKINLSDVLYLEALKNYTIINTSDKKFRVLQNIGHLLKDKNFQSFVRIHRSFAVQKHFIEKITSQEIILKNNFSVPVGRIYKDNLNEIL
ncbi:LytTR family DNA-binding domain-containing protein [Flavobacterium sp.]|uniref:LytR/AlgR family response regulator transcription factor n=1 Tax=Flavobacterium sp. TaxID=239 RepID=UPI003266C0B1